MLLSACVRTLKVKCPTWQHVETFYERKLRRDNTLSIRVPFAVEAGSTLVLGLQLPNDMVMAIDSTVLEASPLADARKSSIRLHLHGMTDEVVERLRTLVADSRRGHSITSAPSYPLDLGSIADPAAADYAAADRDDDDDQSAIPRAQFDAASAELSVPVAQPQDAPISELIEAPFVPDVSQVGEYERHVFIALDTELLHLKEKDAHQVLGVAENASVEEVRSAYFKIAKRYHPDLFAQYRSEAIMHLAQEVYIYINRAYDRLRDSLVAAGRGITAGPALFSHDGWLASFDDLSPESPDPDPYESSEPRLTQPIDELEGLVAQLVSTGSFENAREHVASALHSDPRNRRLRALYYVISGKEAIARGDLILAANQFEAALAHDRDCHEARVALGETRSGTQQSGLAPRASSRSPQ